MIFTSSLSNLKKVNDEIVKILVVRFIPKNLSIDNYNMIWIKKLSPEEKYLLQFVNKELSFDEFSSKYNEYLDEILPQLNEKFKELIKTKDVCFICVCGKNKANMCHRAILAKRISDKFNIEFKGEI